MKVEGTPITHSNKLVPNRVSNYKISKQQSYLVRKVEFTNYCGEAAPLFPVGTEAGNKGRLHTRA